MTIDTRHDTYTGGEHYWVRFHNGTHEVMKETHFSCLDNKVVFSGHYEDCVDFIENLVRENMDGFDI